MSASKSPEPRAPSPARPGARDRRAGEPRALPAPALVIGGPGSPEPRALSDRVARRVVTTRKTAQTVLEYVILMMAVIVALVAMQTYLKFASASRIKSASDNLSPILVNPDGGEVAFQDCRLSSEELTNPPGLFGQHRSSIQEDQLQFSALSGSIPLLPKCFWE